MVNYLQIRNYPTYQNIQDWNSLGFVRLSFHNKDVHDTKIWKKAFLRSGWQGQCPRITASSVGKVIMQTVLLLEMYNNTLLCVGPHI